MANNCLVRAIFHPPTQPPPPWSTSVYHTILRQDLDIISYCFRNEYLEFQNFHNILPQNLKYITIFNMAACHIFRPSPLKEIGNHRLEITETRNYVPEEARGPLFGPGTLTQ